MVTSFVRRFQWDSSHPRFGAIGATSAEFFVFVALLDFRRGHRLRKGQRQRQLAYQHTAIARVLAGDAPL